jgi:hypothetical protein
VPSEVGGGLYAPLLPRLRSLLFSAHASKLFLLFFTAMNRPPFLLRFVFAQQLDFDLRAFPRLAASARQEDGVQPFRMLH